VTRPVARARACSISEWRCGHLSEWRVSNRPTMTPNARDAAPFCGVAAVLVRRARKGVVSSKFHRPSERLSRTFAQRSSDLTFVPTSSTIAVWAARPTCGVFLGRGREQTRSRPHCTSRLSASCLACSWLIGRWAATARAMRDWAGAGGGSPGPPLALAPVREQPLARDWCDTGLFAYAVQVFPSGRRTALSISASASPVNPAAGPASAGGV